MTAAGCGNSQQFYLTKQIRFMKTILLLQKNNIDARPKS